MSDQLSTRTTWFILSVLTCLGIVAMALIVLTLMWVAFVLVLA